MPEQLLDDPQVGSALEQVRRERVAQRVRADPVGQAGAGGRALDRGPGLLAGQPAASIAQEERPAADRRDVVERDEGRPRTVDPAGQPVERDLADRDEPLLVALADDPDERAVDVADPRGRG